MAEPIEMPFGLWTQVGPRKHALHGGAHWRHLANTAELSICAAAPRHVDRRKCCQRPSRVYYTDCSPLLRRCPSRRESRDSSELLQRLVYFMTVHRESNSNASRHITCARSPLCDHPHPAYCMRWRASCRSQRLVQQ